MLDVAVAGCSDDVFGGLPTVDCTHFDRYVLYLFENIREPPRTDKTIRN